jgi:hypothetical protein
MLAAADEEKNFPGAMGLTWSFRVPSGSITHILTSYAGPKAPAGLTSVTHKWTGFAARQGTKGSVGTHQCHPQVDGVGRETGDQGLGRDSQVSLTSVTHRWTGNAARQGTKGSVGTHQRHPQVDGVRRETGDQGLPAKFTNVTWQVMQDQGLPSTPTRVTHMSTG